VNGTTLDRPDVTSYLEAVRAELADLPVEEQDELVADLEAQLLESDEPPNRSPRAFADELREAAGLNPAGPAAEPTTSFLDSLRRWLASERGVRLRATARELEPVWWAVRGVVAAGLLVFATGWEWTIGLDGALALAIAVACVSIWLGLRARRTGSGRRVWRLVDLALLVALVPTASVSMDVLDSRGYVVAYDAAGEQVGLVLDGAHVQNVYAYDREGEPLFDVRLYDQDGRPVDLFPDSGDPSRRVPVDAQGNQLFNAFPLRYYEPGSTTVAEPSAAPDIEVPEIATPPLEPPR
jgi:hypothetical protein